MGCLAIIMLVLAAYLGGFFANGGRSSLHPDTIIDTNPIPAPTELAIFDAPAHASAADLGETALVLSARLEALGIEPDVRSYANNDPSIAVLLPGNEDLPDVIDLLEQRGYLELVDLSGKNPADYANTPLWTTGQEHLTEVIPGDVTGAAQVNGDPPLQTILDSSMVTSASYYLYANGKWVLQINFTDEGAAILEAYTTAHLREPFGIVLDRQLVATSSIGMPLSDNLVIPAEDIATDPRTLAAIINSGPLPIPLTFDRLS